MNRPKKSVSMLPKRLVWWKLNKLSHPTFSLAMGQRLKQVKQMVLRRKWIAKNGTLSRLSWRTTFNRITSSWETQTPSMDFRKTETTSRIMELLLTLKPRLNAWRLSTSFVNQTCPLRTLTSLRARHKNVLASQSRPKKKTCKLSYNAKKMQIRYSTATEVQSPIFRWEPTRMTTYLSIRAVWRSQLSMSTIRARWTCR